MKYAQINVDGTFDRELPDGNIVFDDRNFCTAAALVHDGKAEQFRVVELLETAVPAINPAAEVVARDGAEKLDGQWQYKWTITTLSAPTIAANLAAAKTAKNTQINSWRAQANQTSFTHATKQIACDALSRSDIDAVAGSVSLSGAFPAGFPGAWKAMDNSYLMLPDIAAFKALYASMTLQGTINFGKSQNLKTALAAATTIEQVNALVWA